MFSKIILFIFFVFLVIACLPSKTTLQPTAPMASSQGSSAVILETPTRLTNQLIVTKTSLAPTGINIFPALSPSATIVTNISTPSPTQASPTDIGYLAINGRYAYIEANSRVNVIDISDPKNLRLVGQSDPIPGIWQLTLLGNRLYGGGNGLYILDVSNPVAPYLLGSLKTPGVYIGEVLIENNLVIANGRESGLVIFDASNPAKPFLLSKTSIKSGDVGGIAIAGTYVYVAGRDELTYKNGGLQIFDITRPQKPVSAATYDLLDVLDVKISVPYAYLIAYDSRPGYRLLVFDISIPSKPHQVGSFDLLVKYDSLMITSGYAFLSGFFCNDVTGQCRTIGQIIDITNPLSPSTFETYVDQSSLRSIPSNGWNVVWDGINYRVSEKGVEVWQLTPSGVEPKMISEINLLKP